MTYEKLNRLNEADRAKIKASAPTFFEVRVLRILHFLHRGNIEHLRRARLHRLALHQRIVECAEDGKILVIESGRDCDCVEYHGKTMLCPANVRAFDRLHDEIAKWADGPFRLDIDKPSNRDRYEYRSRDLALEAFEDGHQHHIVSSFG